MAEYIEREKAIEAMKKAPVAFMGTVNALMDLIEDIPAADVRPVVRGRWERHFSRPCVYADLFWHCSVCGYKNAESFANTYHHFCPNCGADMRETEDEKA